MKSEDVIKKAKNYALSCIKKRPHLKSEIGELFSLLQTEIEDGSSPVNEYDLFIAEVDDLMEEHDNF